MFKSQPSAEETDRRNYIRSTSHETLNQVSRVARCFSGVVINGQVVGHPKLAHGYPYPTGAGAY